MLSTNVRAVSVGMHTTGGIFSSPLYTFLVDLTDCVDFAATPLLFERAAQ